MQARSVTAPATSDPTAQLIPNDPGHFVDGFAIQLNGTPRWNQSPAGLDMIEPKRRGNDVESNLPKSRRPTDHAVCVHNQSNSRYPAALQNLLTFDGVFAGRPGLGFKPYGF